MGRSDKTIKKYIKSELEKEIDKRLAEAPWWCMICGVGGNYEGLRPDNFWIPPDDHVCEVQLPSPYGIV